MDSETKKKIQGIKELSAAAEYGIDISALIDNVNRTTAELIKRHQIALETAKKLSGAKIV